MVAVLVYVVLVSHLQPLAIVARELRLDRLMVAGAAGRSSPGSPVVLGDVASKLKLCAVGKMLLLI